MNILMKRRLDCYKKEELERLVLSLRNEKEVTQLYYLS